MLSKLSNLAREGKDHPTLVFGTVVGMLCGVTDAASVDIQCNTLYGIKQAIVTPIRNISVSDAQRLS